MNDATASKLGQTEHFELVRVQNRAQVHRAITGKVEVSPVLAVARNGDGEGGGVIGISLFQELGGGAEGELAVERDHLQGEEVAVGVRSDNIKGLSWFAGMVGSYQWG